MSYIPNRLRGISRKVYYHEALVLLPSALPMLLSLCVTSLLVSLVSWYNPTVLDNYISNNVFLALWCIMAISIFEIVVTITTWLSDTLVESSLGGYYTAVVRKNIRYGFYAFVLSEAMLFFSFFWSFLHSGFSPTPQLGGIFPPTGTPSVLAIGLPLWGTFLLVASGFVITWMNKVLIIGKGKRFEFLLSLVGTIVFGLMFMMVQAVEYTSFSANFNDSVFGSCFYMLTGFHGFHVILGLVFLNVCLWLHYKRIFLNTVHVFAELAIVYWHFVDIIWIGLFFIVYCWGFGDLGTMLEVTDNEVFLSGMYEAFDPSDWEEVPFFDSSPENVYDYYTKEFNSGAYGTIIAESDNSTLLSLSGIGIFNFSILRNILPIYNPVMSDGPSAWQIFFQSPSTDSARELILFHGYLCTLIIVLAVFVFKMLFHIVRSFESNFVTGRGSVNYTVYQVLEFWWTVIPGLIILGLSVSSLLLIYSWDAGLGISLEGRSNNILNTLLLKVRGSQWFWTYEYVFKLVNRFLKWHDYENMQERYKTYLWNTFSTQRLLKYESHMSEVSDMFLLETTASVKLPLRWVIKFVVTASDVIHSWAVPSFGMKVDAIPGRANVQSVITQGEGRFYGQCSEICGIKHAFMPIEVEVLDDTWLVWYIKNSSPRWLINSIWSDHASKLIKSTYPLEDTRPYKYSNTTLTDMQVPWASNVSTDVWLGKEPYREPAPHTDENFHITWKGRRRLPVVLAGVLGLRVLKGNRGVIKNMGISQVVTTLDKRVSNVNSNTRNFKEKVGSREKFKLGNLIQKTTFKVLNDVHNYWYTTPGNLGNSYAMGFLLLFSIFLQILTGLFLVANYEPSVENAFYSVIWLKRDVFGGGYVQSVHSIGASIIFMALYLHLFRGLYFASYKKRNTWITGVCIYFLVALIAFLGYCLPWGQMSLWGCKVITSFLTAVPYVGTTLVEWVWGGASINDQTLKRFYMAHIGLNAILIFFIGLHIRALHVYGSSSPISSLGSGNIVFFPYVPLKDVFMIYTYTSIILVTLYTNPNFFSHPENFIPANPMVTPDHIVPEWYFLPFYAILRSIPDKELGLIAMLGSIVIWATLPWITGDKYTGRDNVYFTQGFSFLICVVLLLGWLGTQPLRQPYTGVAGTFTVIYFFYFIIFLPQITSIAPIKYVSNFIRWTAFRAQYRLLRKKYPLIISEKRYVELKIWQLEYILRRNKRRNAMHNRRWKNLYSIKRTMKH